VTNVLIIRYLPTVDGQQLDVSYSPDYYTLNPVPLQQMSDTLDALDLRIKFMLEEGTRFRAHGSQSVAPAVGYRVVKSITVYEPTPPGMVVSGGSGSPAQDATATAGLSFPDWESIWSRFGVRDLIETSGVREIWFWSGDADPSYPSFDPTINTPDKFRTGWESEMASPSVRVCNCGADSGLPVYNNSYVVYGYNIRRTQAEAVHDHGHQAEATLNYVNGFDPNTYLFWGEFVGIPTPGGNFVPGRCGDTHYPPNGRYDYDYQDPNPVLSDCDDWRPDGQGQQKLINDDEWGKIHFAWPDPDPAQIPQLVESQYYIYWRQSQPGWGSSIPDSLPGRRMSNWWTVGVDWDAALNAKYGLTQPAVNYQVTPSPASAPSAAASFTLYVGGPPGANAAWIAHSNTDWIAVIGNNWGNGPGHVELQLQANTGTAARTGTVGVADQLITITQVAQGPGQPIVNDAREPAGTGGAPLVPGGLFELLGSGLNLRSADWSSSPWPTLLSATEVHFDALDAPLIFVSPTSIMGQVPFEVTPGNHSLRLDSDTGSFSRQVSVIAAAPQLFLDANGAMARNRSGAMNGPASPARPGEPLTVYLTGCGPIKMDSKLVTGVATPSKTYPVQAAASASLGSTAATISYLGLTPGIVGVCEADLVVPLINPGSYPLSIVIGGAASNAGLIYVGAPGGD
jgi:uncharacterized protein (TIGR03437 family)